MNKPTLSLLALLAIGAAVPAIHAQPAVNFRVVDMAKLYDSHYKTIEQGNKFTSDQKKAQEEVDRLNKEGNALVEAYKALAEQANNPALSAEAKTRAQGDAQKQLESIQAKQQEIQTFAQTAQNSLEQRLQSFRTLMIEEIAKLATEVGKRRGATVLVDKAGPSMFGISNMVYTDPGFDITDEVMAEINKSKPVAAPGAPAPAAPAAAPAAPTVNLPGIQPKK
jgi:outer membrane protein